MSETLKRDTFYPVYDRVPGSLAAMDRLTGIHYKAKWTGEKRAPKKGEWYLSGAIIAAYIAPNDYPNKTQFAIAKLYRVRKVEYWEEVKDGS